LKLESPARLPFLFVIGLGLGASIAAQNDAAWPQWRGPDRDGISKETGWRVHGTEILWSMNVGTGYSCVSIRDGRLYTIGHDPGEQEDTIHCLDALTGKKIWSHTFPVRTMNMGHGGGSLSTPSIDGDRVWVSSREGRFFCFDARSGKIRWKRDLIKKYKAQKPTWGLAASPLVLEEMIVMNVGPVIAFKRRGRVLWKTKDFGQCYSTPVDFERQGKRYLAVFNGTGLMVLTRKRGRKVASSEWKTRHDVNAATPVVVAGGTKIFISSGYGRGCAMLGFDGKKLETLWESKVMRNQMSGCVAFGDHLYGFDETTVKCLDFDGKVRWAQRGLGKGALVIADGKLVMVSARGDLVLAEATPEAYRELSRTKVPRLSGGVKWTTPVVCGGLIYCRSSQGELVCLDRRRGKGSQ
jgi:outer membrane protein assembly factor BamB